MLFREDLISVMRRNCILTPIADDGADGEGLLPGRGNWCLCVRVRWFVRVGLCGDSVD